MITVLSYVERGSLVWEQHREILETLARGEVERGVALVTDHIKGAEAAILGAIGDVFPAADDAI